MPGLERTEGKPLLANIAPMTMLFTSLSDDELQVLDVIFGAS